MRILVAESAEFSPQAASLLGEAGELTLADLDAEGLRRSVSGYDVLWVRLRSLIDRDILEAARGLRAIATPTTGLTHIDLDETGRRGIPVLSLRGEAAFLRSVRATAELTIALMLSLLRNLPAAAEHAKLGHWERDRFRGGELYGGTVGLIGFGRLGRLVAGTLQAFDARVLAYDPYVDAASAPPGVTLCPLNELLRESDLVSLHACLNPETNEFFGKEQLALMRPGSLLINTARGELIDEDALLEALRSKHLAGAALDVIANEHMLTERHPLLAYAREHENLLITPHIGGCTKSSMERTEVFLARKVCRWIIQQAVNN